MTPVNDVRHPIPEGRLMSPFLKIQLPTSNRSADLDTMLRNLSKMSVFILFLKCLGDLIRLEDFRVHGLLRDKQT